MKTRSLIIAVLCVLVLSCTSEKSPITKNESGVIEPNKIDLGNSASDDLINDERGRSISEFESFKNIESFYNSNKKINVSKALSKLIELQDIVLNPKNIRKFQNIPSNSIYNNYEVFNQLYADLLKEGIDNQEIMEIGKKYQTVVFDGCEGDELTLFDCNFVKSFFKKDPQFIKILKFWITEAEAKVSSSLEEKNVDINSVNIDKDSLFQLFSEDKSLVDNFVQLYKVIFLAQNIVNSATSNSKMISSVLINNQFYFLTLEFRTADCYKIGSEFSNKVQRCLSGLGEIQKRAESLASFSEYVTRNEALTKDYCAQIKKQKPFDYDFFVENNTVADIDVTKYQKALDQYISCANESGHLESDLEAYVQKIKSEINDTIPNNINSEGFVNVPGVLLQSYFSVKNELQNLPKLTGSLDINLSEDKDDKLFYVLESIYQGNMDASMAYQFFNPLDVDGIELMETADRYMKVRFAHMTYYSFRDFYLRFENERKISSTLSSLAYENITSELNSSWGDGWASLESNFQNIRKFVENILSSRLSHNVLDSYKKEQKLFDDFKDKLDRDALVKMVNQYVVEPMTMITTFYIIQDDSIPKIKIGWVSNFSTDTYWEVRTDGITVDPFNEDTSRKYRLFNFTKNRYSYSRFEKLNTFEFLIRSGMLEVFPLNFLEALDEKPILELLADTNIEEISIEDRSILNLVTMFFIRPITYLKEQSKLRESNSEKALKVIEDSDLYNICTNPFDSSRELDLGNEAWKSVNKKLTPITDFSKLASNVSIDSLYDSTSLDSLTKLKTQIEKIENIFRIVRSAQQKRNGQELDYDLKGSVYEIYLNALQKDAHESFATYFSNLTKIDKKLSLNDDLHCFEAVYRIEDYRQKSLYDFHEDYYKNQVYPAWKLLALESLDIASFELEANTSLDDVRDIVDQYLNDIKLGLDALPDDLKVTEDEKEIILSFSDKFKEFVLKSAENNDDLIEPNIYLNLQNSLNFILGSHGDVILKDFGFYFQEYDGAGKNEGSLALTRFNSLSIDGYRQYEWDTLLRSAWYINVGSKASKSRTKSDVFSKVYGEDYVESLSSINQFTNKDGTQINVSGVDGLKYSLPSLLSIKNDKILKNGYYSKNTGEAKSNFSIKLNKDDFVERILVDSHPSRKNRTEALYQWYTNATDNGLELMKTRLEYLKRMYVEGGIPTKLSDFNVCDINPLKRLGSLSSPNTWGELKTKTDDSSFEAKECNAFSISKDLIVKQYLRLIDYARLNNIDSEEVDGFYFDYIKLTDLEFLLHDRYQLFFNAVKLPKKNLPEEWTLFDKFLGSWFAKKGSANNFDDVHGINELVKLKNGIARFDFKKSLVPFNDAIRFIERDFIRKKTYDQVYNYINFANYVRDLEKNFDEILPDSYRKIIETPLVFLNVEEPEPGEVLLDDKWRFFETAAREDGTPVLLKDNGVVNSFILQLKGIVETDLLCWLIPEANDFDYEMYNSEVLSASTSRFERECSNEQAGIWADEFIKVVTQGKGFN